MAQLLQHRCPGLPNSCTAFSSRAHRTFPTFGSSLPQFGLQQRRSAQRILAATADGFAQDPDARSQASPQQASSSLQGHSSQTGRQTRSEYKVSAWQRIKDFFAGDRIDRKRLAALGLGAVASYGFVSNATYGTGLAVSWVAFVRQCGKSPLMAGQWKPFLAFYAGRTL